MRAPQDDRTDDDATTDLAVSSIVTSKLPAWSSAAPEQVAEGLVQLLRWIGVTIADDKRLLCKVSACARAGKGFRSLMRTSACSTDMSRGAPPAPLP